MLLEHTSYVEVLRETVPPEDIPGSVSLAKESVLRVARVGEVNDVVGSSELEKRDSELHAADVGSGRGFLLWFMCLRFFPGPMSGL